jgi:DNA-binding MarR family transcriptional regulator
MPPGKKGRTVKTRLLARVTAVVAVAGVLAASGWAEEAKPPAAKKKVTLSVFDPAVQTVAPGIEKVITLSEEQRAKLERIYNEVLGSDAVAEAQKVLQNEKSPAAARAEATETLQSAQDWFRKRCAAEVFTPQQNALIKKIYAAYNDVRQEAIKDLAARITEGFSKRLEAILTPEQKAAMEKGRTETPAPAGAPAQAGAPTN